MFRECMWKCAIGVYGTAFDSVSIILCSTVCEWGHAAMLSALVDIYTHVHRILRELVKMEREMMRYASAEKPPERDRNVRVAYVHRKVFYLCRPLRHRINVVCLRDLHFRIQMI